MARCSSPTEAYWLGVLFGYKIIFQAIGVFLAFKIRKVKIHGLNESREVSAILYITSIMLVIMIVVSYAFGDYIDVEAAVFGFGLSTLITVVLGLTFVPKVKILIGKWCYRGLYLISTDVGIVQRPRGEECTEGDNSDQWWSPGHRQYRRQSSSSIECQDQGTGASTQGGKEH